MPQKPITTFATAIAFGVLASAAIAAPDQQAATAGSECHAAPKGVAPPGAHWYYKTNRATNKKCWYLADEVAKPKKATRSASTRSSVSDDAAPQAESKTEKKAESIADARAEIPDDNKPTASKPATSQPATNDQGLADSVWPALPDKSETGTAAAARPAPASDDTGAFASRWPDQVSTTAATDAQVMLARKQAEQTQAAAQPQSQQQPQSAIAPTVGRTAPAMADEPAESPISTIGLLLSVLAGLLALAAIIGPAVFKRRSRRKPKAARRGIWDSVDHDNSPMPWDAVQNVRNDNTPSEIRDLDATNNELQKILQRASKRSAA